jgi:fructokinase
MIICCGEALIDMLPREATTGERAFAPLAGGAVFNTAIALGRLGAPAGFFSGLSSDLFGQVLQDALAQSRVDAGHAVISDRPTTLAFVTLTDGHAQYAFYDEGTAGRMLSTADLPDLPAKVSTLFFGGISLVVEPCAEAYRALASRERDRRVIMIDPNIRPGFITDQVAYRARITEMLTGADIVKISDEDLAWLGAGHHAFASARGLLELGPKVVLLTEGSKGARALTLDHEVFVEARKVAVVDTVGAGDTFNAGVLAALELHDMLSKTALARIDADTLRAALTLGVRAAAITVSRAGANPPWAKEL